MWKIYRNIFEMQQTKIVSQFVCQFVPHMLHLLHTASCYQRYLHLPIDWQQVQSVDVLNLICQLVACCLLPVACCCLRLMMLVVGLLLLAVVIAVAAACCCCCYCCASGKMSATWQHAWLANECQTYWTVANVSDWQAMHTHQQHSNTHTLDCTHLAHFAGVALVF